MTEIDAYCVTDKGRKVGWVRMYHGGWCLNPSDHYAPRGTYSPATLQDLERAKERKELKSVRRVCIIL